MVADDGGNVTLECTNCAYPSNVQYQWKMNDTDINGQTSNTYTIYNVTDLHFSSDFQCIANNSVGTNIKFIKILKSGK
jgi:hypothetical protein